MESLHSASKHDCRLAAILGISLMFISLESFAQVNSWTKPTSGSWEEPYWSLGRPPAFDDRVFINNPGWKAVQISSSTVQTIPDSLNVYSIEVTSPVDSFNTLLLNYAGFDRPLTVNYSMTIGPGAALTMHSSALRIQTPTGVGLSVGGEVNQNDFSEVTGNQVDIGWVGPGVYNLNSGLVQLQHLWVGGPNNGVFNQNGGSNGTGIVHFENGGTYNLRDGDFNTTTYTSDGTVFRQDGGQVYSLLEFFGGQYILNNGINYGGVSVPVYGNYQNGNATAVQNGGTILGPIRVGALSGGGTGGGSFTLSNGVISAPFIALSMFGHFYQYGGSVTTTGKISMSYGYFNRSDVGPSDFHLERGSLSSSGIRMDLASFVQNSGTNQVNGDLELLPGSWYGTTSFGLNGGLLVTENTLEGFSEGGGFFQSGGTHRVANTVNITGWPNIWGGAWRGYQMSGGQLITANLSLNTKASFIQTGGTIVQSGTTILNTGYLFPGPGTQQFGALQLSTTNGLTMPANSSSIVRFRSSSGLTWDSTAWLMITNWAGSYQGGGSHRIIFGNSSSALTPQQVAKISFRDPAGLSQGLYAAKILSTGEIVPDTGAIGRIPPRLAIRRISGRTQITLNGEAGFNYGILRGDTLSQWSLWTNGTATNGTLTFVDPTTSAPKRFYRGVLMP